MTVVNLQAKDIPMSPPREVAIDTAADTLMLTLRRPGVPIVAAARVLISWGSTGWVVAVYEEEESGGLPAIIVLADGEPLRIEYDLEYDE
jgi:hypothetical protein